MSSVRSSDGTSIGFEQIGSGPPVILIDGALCYRGMGPSAQLATLLAKDFTVFTYDRRGRGESGDTAPCSLDRELDDIAALVAQTDGRVFLSGVSSGAMLALEAANRIASIAKVALYEAPLIVDNTRSTTVQSWIDIRAAIAANQRGAAVRAFLKAVGAPGFFVALMRLTPTWAKLTAVAQTLPYDGTIVQAFQRGEPLPTSRWNSIVPTLVIDGGKSPQWIRNGNRALADVLPNAQYRTLAGQTHMVNAAVLAPILAEFFNAT